MFVEDNPLRERGQGGLSFDRRLKATNIPGRSRERVAPVLVAPAAPWSESAEGNINALGRSYPTRGPRPRDMVSRRSRRSARSVRAAAARPSADRHAAQAGYPLDPL